jgi:hypothetical protein
METFEYQVVLVNKWGKAVRQGSGAGTETWQFDDSRASELVALLADLGSGGWDLIGIDTNASYAHGSYSYVGSLYIFQRAV